MTTIGTKRGKYRTWTKADHDRLIAYVRDNGEQFDAIAVELGRTVEAVRNRVHRHGPPEMRHTKKHRSCPDLTSAQIEEAKRIRATGYRGTMDLRKIARIMGVRLVQLNRVFRPHEIERTRSHSEAIRQYVTNDAITVPQDVIIERDRAMARPRFCAAEILGEPPPGRSALDRIRAGLSA